MAFRYRIIVSHSPKHLESAPVSIAPSPDFSFVLHTPRMAILANKPSDTVAFSDHLSIILGQLFDRHTYVRTPRLTLSQENRSVATRGKSLANHVWGAYVGAFTDLENQAVSVCRDPAGGLPCYYVNAGSHTLIASDVECLFQTGLIDIDIDWSNLFECLSALDLPSPRTALKGVMELLPGHTLTIMQDGTSSTSIHWSPWDHVDGAPLTTAEAVQRTRETLLGCVQAWGSTASKPIVSLSGGLDSSAVAWALAQQASDWSCMTMVSDGPEGDERSYASLVAAHLGKPLIEALHSADGISTLKASSTSLPRPTGNILIQSFDHLTRHYADHEGADVLFTGIGGDNVFCSMQSATPLTDRVRAEGFNLGTWQTLLDICKLADCTLWEAAGAAVKRALGSPGYNWHFDRRLLSEQSESTLPNDLHPWLRAPATALPGKAAHIAMLIRVQATMETRSRQSGLTQINPLLSQPLLELCLGIQTWQWCAGGQNRSVTRQALSGQLPGAIVNRRSKGGPDAFCIDVLNREKAALSNHLLNGRLARNGLLDVTALKNILEGPDPIRPPLHLRVAALAEAESWIRHWESEKETQRQARRAGESGSERVRYGAA